MSVIDADGLPEMAEAAREGSGRNPQEARACASKLTATANDSNSGAVQLMDAVVERENMLEQRSRVTRRPTLQASTLLMNRRIRNRTSGGVGGRGLITPSYPIPQKSWLRAFYSCLAGAILA